MGAFKSVSLRFWQILKLKFNLLKFYVGFAGANHLDGQQVPENMQKLMKLFGITAANIDTNGPPQNQQSMGRFGRPIDFGPQDGRQMS